MQDKLKEEYAQAIARMALSLFATIVLFILDKESIFFKIILFYVFYSIFHFLWVKFSKIQNVFRQYLAIVGDISMVTVGMLIANEAGAFFYFIYLWIIVGNGMRFGIKHLFIAQMLALIEFAFALNYNEFWHDIFLLGVGLWFGIVILPLFYYSLIIRLQNTQYLDETL
jgi:two-component system sensor histidine kinase RpfC